MCTPSVTLSTVTIPVAIAASPCTLTDAVEHDTGDLACARLILLDELVLVVTLASRSI